MIIFILGSLIIGLPYVCATAIFILTENSRKKMKALEQENVALRKLIEPRERTKELDAYRGDTLGSKLELYEKFMTREITYDELHKRIEASYDEKGN